MSDEEKAGNPTGPETANGPAGPPDDEQAQPAAESWVPPHPSRTRLAAIGLAILGAVMVVLYAWNLPPFAGSTQSTDNAYVRGKVTIISPQVSGYVTAVLVKDFAQVKKGQVIATIDNRQYAARVEQARANLAAQKAALANSQQSERARKAALGGQNAAIMSAQAQLAKAQADMARANALVSDGSISARERDQTRAALRAAEASVAQAQASRGVGEQDVRSVLVAREGLGAAVEAAEAQLHAAEVDLENTVIRAPEDGQLSEVGVRIGALVTAGTQLMFLVPNEVWVIANFKESQTARMAVGLPASFTVDALAGAQLTGRVESIAPAAGSEFAVLKADNATGNFVKVSQRIAVRIRIDPGQDAAKRLRPGMSVEARVETGS